MSKVIVKLVSLSASLIMAFAATVVSAQNIQLRDDYPDLYVVVKGDTLWDISGTFLQNPASWPQIWRVNPQIENPDLIYPGDTIALRFVDGQPVLELQRGNGSDRNPVRNDLPVVRLSPRVRREPLQGGLSEISLEDIDAFLSKNRVVTEEEIENAGYILGTRSGSVLASAGDIIYARGSWSEGAGSYQLVQPKRTFKIPGEKEALGVEVTHVGDARVISIDSENVATLEVTYTDQEVRMTDRVIPHLASPLTSGYEPTIPDFEVDATILGFQSGRDYGGGLDTVILDVGENNRLESGYLLSVKRPDYEFRDTHANENVSAEGERFASVLIYRVFDKASLGLILNSVGEVKVGDKVVAQ